MLKFWQKYYGWALLVLVIGVILWFVGDSEGFKNCICNTNNEYASQASQEGHPYIYIAFRSYIGCFGVFLENNDGAVTALATIIMAIFTCLLWVSTNRLWKEATDAGKTALIAANAAEKAAKVAESALLNVERPYLLVTASSFNMGVNSAGIGGNLYHPVVTYSVSNHGKLPAIIDSVCAEVIHAPDEELNAPISVEDTDPLLMDRVIESKGWRQNLEFRDSTIDGATANSTTLTDHEIFFWIIINYHGPFTKGHETSGCWRVSFGDTLTLVQYGHEKYNYTK